mgnify:CR=1 FL=1
MLKFDIITIFPNIFDGFTSESLISKAQKKKLIKIQAHNLRDWTEDRHQTVDGKPYGGGPGLVFKVEPIFKAVKKILPSAGRQKTKKSKVILFSPRGKKFTQDLAKKWAKLDQLVFICGRYEGVDERVAEHIADEVVSVGDYVLNGGEVPAMLVIEAVSRHLPGFMHKEESSSKNDHAQYTKPEIFVSKKGTKWRVPRILLSGNHAKIKIWRDSHK